MTIDAAYTASSRTRTSSQRDVVMTSALVQIAFKNWPSGYRSIKVDFYPWILCEDVQRCCPKLSRSLIRASRVRFNYSLLGSGVSSLCEDRESIDGRGVVIRLALADT